MNEQGNECVFSRDRIYRYTLLHTWKAANEAPHYACWIALNPSTADENKLDPTLRRIRGFSRAWGYNGFMMLNAFAFRATNPRDMEAAADPVGADNDAWILSETAKADRVICAWGTHARGARQDAIIKLLAGRPLCFLRLTASGCPSHPLYLPGTLLPVQWTPCS